MSKSKDAKINNKLFQKFRCLVDVKPKSKELQELLEKYGAKIITTWSPSITHLVFADGNASIHKKAKEANIRIVTPEYFAKSIEADKVLSEDNYRAEIPASDKSDSETESKPKTPIKQSNKKPEEDNKKRTRSKSPAKKEAPKKTEEQDKKSKKSRSKSPSKKLKEAEKSEKEEEEETKSPSKKKKETESEESEKEDKKTDKKKSRSKSPSKKQKAKEVEDNEKETKSEKKRSRTKSPSKDTEEEPSPKKTKNEEKSKNNKKNKTPQKATKHKKPSPEDSDDDDDDDDKSLSKLKTPELSPEKSPKKRKQDGKKHILITGCHTAERENIRAAAKKLDDVVIATRYGPSVTHIVLGDDHRRTVKVLQGIVDGKWIVTMNWVLDSAKHKKWLDEFSYEDSKKFPGCKKSREMHEKEQHKLFSNKKFYLWGNMEEPTKSDIEKMLAIMGGKVTSAEKADVVLRGEVEPEEEQEFEAPVVKLDYLFDCVQEYSVLKKLQL